MSKTVSGQDVEDMLSSVRRLVSNELPPHPSVSRAPDAGKLVLTEAQRIEPQRKVERPRSKRLEDRIAELEAAVSRSSDEWEPDGSEDQAQNQPDRIVYTPPEPRRTMRRISRITLKETDRVSPAEDDGSAKDLSEAERKAVAKSAKASEEPDRTTFDEALDKAVTESLDALSPEEKVAVRQEMERPEVPAEAASAETAAPEPEPAAATEAVPAPQVPANDGREATPIDEAALRPLVNKLLREELQGEIGERITRNVRKLVRQEIQRALALQELD